MKDCKKKTCCELCKKRKVEEKSDEKKKSALLSILEATFKGKTITVSGTQRKKVYEESKLKPYH